MNKRKTLKDINRYTSSPFKEELFNNPNLQPHCKPVKEGKTLMDEDTGALYDIDVITSNQYFWKDSEPYTKLFRNPEYILTLASLGSAAVKMLSYIIGNLPINTDIIIIPFSFFKEHANITSRSVYYDAISELTEKRVIALTNSPHTFYINPNFIFNGKREVLLPDAQQEYFRKYKSRI